MYVYTGEAESDDRPKYRTSKNKDISTKVYTITNESKFLIVANVPLGNIKEIVQLCSSFGEIDEYRLLDEDNPDPYTDDVRFNFKSLDSARAAKLELNKSSFIGHVLSVWCCK